MNDSSRTDDSLLADELDQGTAIPWAWHRGGNISGTHWLFEGLDMYESSSLGLNVGASGWGHQGDNLATHRGSVVQSRPLSPVVLPCLHRHLLKSMSLISDIFPSSPMSPELTYLSMLSYGSTIPPVCRPRLLLLGGEGVGLDHLGPAILHELKHFPIHSLGLPSLLSYPGAKTPEEALLHIFTEARRRTPSILYIPMFNKWWGNAHQQLRDVFLSLLEELPSDLPILLLATSYGELSDLGEQSVFDRQSVYTVDKPSSEDRSLFFDRLFEAALSVISGLYGKHDGPQQPLSELPKVAKAPAGPKPNVEAEQHALLRLRMCLRDVCNR